MRKISTKPYTVVVPGENGEKKTDEYDMKESLGICLLHPSLQLSGRELLLRGKILDKIEQANGELILEEAEYSKLKASFEKVKGFSKNDMEMVKRVFNAQEIEVKEAGK